MDKQEVKEVAEELFGWEGNKYLRTIVYLTIKPGVIITEYCQGEKQKYVSPVVYFFALAGIFLYVQSNSGLEDMFKTLPLGEIFASIGMPMSNSQITAFINAISNQNLMLLLSLPWMLMVTWYVFKRENPSFKQSSWFALYTSAQLMLPQIVPLLFFWLISRTAFMVVYQLLGPVTIVYTFWAAKQFYGLTLDRAILLTFIRLIALMPFNALVVAGIFFVVRNYVK